MKLTTPKSSWILRSLPGIVIASLLIPSSVSQAATNHFGWPVFTGDQQNHTNGMIVGDFGYTAGNEVAFTSWDFLFIYSQDGVLQAKLTIPGISYHELSVGDLDKDGKKEIIVGASKNTIISTSVNAPGGLYAINDTGVKQLTSGYASSWRPVVLDDVNGDSFLDIVEIENVADTSIKIHVRDRLGKDLPGWPVTPTHFSFGSGYKAYSPLAVGDLDRDGKNEVLFLMKDATNQAAPVLFAYRYDGVLLWAKSVGANYSDFQFTYYLAEAFNDVVLGDLDQDGVMDIVVFQEGFRTATKENLVLILDNKGGLKFSQKITSTESMFTESVMQNMSLADLNQDGKLEIVMVGRRVALSAPGCSHDSVIFAWQYNGLIVPGFPYALVMTDYATSLCDKVGTPMIADVNGDGYPDIVSSLFTARNSTRNSMYAWDRYGQMLNDWPISLNRIQTGGTFGTDSPRVYLGDLNNDQRVDLVTGIGGGEAYAVDLGVAVDKMDWPMFRHDAGRTGRYENLPIDPSAIPLIPEGNVGIGTTAPVPLNIAPVFGSIPSQNALKGQLLQFPVLATDSNGDSISLQLLSPQSGMAISIGTTTALSDGSSKIDSLFTWTPVGIGSYSVNIKAQDSLGAFSTKVVPISVTQLNVAPVLSSILPQSGVQGQLLQFPVSATDSNGDTISLQLLNAQSGMAVSTGTNTTLVDGSSKIDSLFTWTPVGIGTYSVTIKAQDPIGAYSTKAVPINVTMSNSAPVFNTVNVPIGTVNAYMQFYFSATDIDGDVASFDLVNAPAGVTWGYTNVTTAANGAKTNEGLVKWTPTTAGSFVVTLKATDSKGASSSVSVAVNVNPAPVNNVPKITSITIATAAAGLPLKIAVTGTDLDRETLILQMTNGPVGAKFTPVTASTFLADGTSYIQSSFDLTPTVLGPNAATFQVTDSRNATMTYTINFNVVSPVGDPVLKIISPANGTKFVPGKILVKAEATSASGVWGVRFIGDDGVAHNDTVAPYASTINTSKWAVGKHTISVLAYKKDLSYYTKQIITIEIIAGSTKGRK